MSITRIQEECDVWVNRNFPNRSKAAVIGGLGEEVGEVLRACVKHDQGIRGTADEWMYELEKELGDVFIKLCDVANFYDIDLELAIVNRWHSVQKRDWVTDPEKGGQ